MLNKEIVEDRLDHNKKPLINLNSKDNDINGGKISKKTLSTTDPESGMFHKGEHERVFAYSAHTACDKNNFILDVVVTAGNVHDSIAFDPLFDKLIDKYTVDNVVADAGYNTPWICKNALIIIYYLFCPIKELIMDKECLVNMTLYIMNTMIVTYVQILKYYHIEQQMEKVIENIKANHKHAQAVQVY